MKIGITTFGCDAGKSGIGSYTMRLLDAFNRNTAGDAFEVLYHPSEEAVWTGSRDNLSRFPVSDRVRNPVVNVAWHQVALQLLVRSRGYQVVFLPAGNRRVPVFSTCPTVGTVHDFAQLHIKGKYDPARTVYQNQVLPFMIRQLTHVITISESSKRDIMRHARVPEERITVIPHGVDHATYRPRDRGAALAALVEKFGVRSPYILYISRIEHPGKNHVRLIEAFDMLKSKNGLPHQLVLVGSDWGRAEAVHDAAERSQYKNDILFTGFASGSDLPGLYAAADLFVFPSLYEGFGMPILEAMASGVPVACSNISSMPEVAGDAAVLFHPHDASDIHSAMERLLTNQALRLDTVRRGLERARQYTWEACAEQTRAVLHAAAAS